MNYFVCASFCNDFAGKSIKLSMHTPLRPHSMRSTVRNFVSSTTLFLSTSVAEVSFKYLFSMLNCTQL